MQQDIRHDATPAQFTATGTPRTALSKQLATNEANVLETAFLAIKTFEPVAPGRLEPTSLTAK